VTATLHRLPFADGRLDAMAAAPADALTLVELAIKRTDRLARLVGKAAPAPEITAAAEAVAALSGPLACLKLTVDVLDAALRAGERRGMEAAEPASGPRRCLHPVPGGKGGAFPEVTR